MASHLTHLALVHHNDLVRALDGAEAVGDDERGAAFDQAGQGLTHAELGLGVHAGGGFVEDEHPGVVGQGAGKADKLFLSGGESVAALLQKAVEALRQCLDEVRGVDLLGGLLQGLARHVLRAQANVIGDRAAEEEWILQHHSAAAAQLLQIHLAHVHAIQSHGALLHVIKAQQQADERCLSGSRVADDGHGLTGFNGEGHAAQNPIPLIARHLLAVLFHRNLAVGEPDVVELDAARPFCAHRHLRRLHLGLGIQQAEDPLTGGHGGLQDVHLLAQVHDGAEEAQRVLHEGHQHAQGS